MYGALKNERGFVMIVALGVMTVVAILGAAALVAAQGSISETVWDRSTNQAFNVAEAGFNQAVARARSGTLTGNFTAKLANGETSVTVTELDGPMFSVKAVGAVPTLAAPTSRRAVQGNVVALNPYDSVFVNGGVSGVINGNASFIGSLYVRDYLELSGAGAGAGSITGGTLYIKDNPATSIHTGDLDMSGSASIGTAADPIYAFIDGSITRGGSSVTYTKAIYSDVPDLDMPVITSSLSDMQAQRGIANLVIDVGTETVTNGNRPLALNAAAPDQTYGDYPGGNYLKWTAATKKLEIKGVVFVDGKVNIGGNTVNTVTFAGKGTIVANGDIAIDSALTPNPTSNFPATDVFGAVTGGFITVNAKAGDNVYGVLYGYQQITIVKKLDFWGSAMTQTLDLQSNPTIHVVPGMGASLPPGMPEAKTTTGITAWREVQP